MNTATTVLIAVCCLASLARASEPAVELYRAPPSLFRVVSIEQLVPESAPPANDSLRTLSTFWLTPQKIDQLAQNEILNPRRLTIAVDSEQGDHLQGLVDTQHHRTLIATTPSADERAVSAQRGGTVARAIVVAAVDDDYVSVYVTSSQFVAGAAHANNDVTCATFARATGRRVDLRTLVGVANAKRILAAARTASHRNIDAPTDDPPSVAFGAFSPTNLLLQRSPRQTNGHEIVLCAETISGAGDGITLQVNADHLPLLMLMKR